MRIFSETPEASLSQDDAPPLSPILVVEKHLEKLDSELQEAKKAIRIYAERHESEMQKFAAIQNLKDEENESLRKQLAIYKQ
jgi:hypothetical protein